MTSVNFTRRELVIKDLLGIPTALMVLLLIVLRSSGNVAYTILFLAAGWYAYHLMYWRLYQTLVLRREPKSRVPFYLTVLGVQAVAGVLLALVLKLQ